MKKLLALLLAAAMCLSLAACGGSNASTEEQPAADDTSETPADEESPAEQPEEPEAETESEPETVTITIPSGYFAEDELEQMIGDTSSGNYESITANDDGSVTVTMTQEQHEALLSVVAETLRTIVAEEFPGDDYPSVKSMEFSDDFTELTLTVDYAAYDSSFDSIAEYLGIFACGFYQIFAGTAPDEIAITISVVDEASGTVERTTSYPDDYADVSEELEGTETGNANILEGSGDLGDYYVEVIGAARTTDYEDKDAITITFSWTNNSEETINVMSGLLYQAFQDGVQMDSTVVESDYSDNEYKEVRPGTTINIDVSYVLTSDSTVEFELSDWTSPDSTIVRTDFDPTNLE